MNLRLALILLALSSSFIGAQSSSHKGMHSEEPAKRWQDALITGNGTMGAMVFGRPNDERVIFNHEKLFEPLRDKIVKSPDIGKHLPEIRKMIAAGDFKGANERFYDEMVKAGYPGILWTDPYHPGYAIRLTSKKAGEVKNYRRSTDFETGEVSVSWADDRGSFVRKTFVSRPDQVIVQEIKGGEGQKFSLEVSLSPQGTQKGGGKKTKAGAGGFHQAEVSTTPSRLTWRLAYQKTVRGYEGLTRVVTDGQKVVNGQALKITDATYLLLISRLNYLENYGESEFKETEATLKALPQDYLSLLKPHAEIHGEMFNRVALDLGGGEQRQWSSEKLLADQKKRPEGQANKALLEKMFNMGIYSIISSNGSYPPNLMGIWNGEVRPAWSGDFTLDSNINLQTSAINLANLPECAASYYNLIHDLLPSFRDNAMRLYGCRGILSGNRTSGREGHQVHHTKGFPGAAWTAGAHWLMAPLIEFYQVTGKEDFLKEKLLPIMMEICLFYEDFLSTTDANGHVVFSPSMSPENKPSNTQLLFAANATMDIACAREALSLTIQYSKHLNVNAEKIPVWEALLKKLPPFLYEKDGALKEWADVRLTDNENHRHGSHFYPVYPGHFARPDLDPKLYQGAILAAEQRGRGNGSAHGLAFMAIFGARLHNPDLVYGNLDFMLRGNYILPSLFTWHNPNEIYNADMLHSLPTAVMEMLAYSRPGVVELLPALSESLPKGSIKGMMTRSRCRIDSLAWDQGKRVVSVTLTSLVDQTLSLKFPREIESLAENQNSFKKENDRSMLRVNLKRGKSVTFDVILRAQ